MYINQNWFGIYWNLAQIDYIRLNWLSDILLKMHMGKKDCPFKMQHKFPLT